MLANYAGLHDALTIDHTPQTALPSGQHDGMGNGTQVKLADRCRLKIFVVGQHQRHRCIELAKAAHDPVGTALLVVPCDAHGFK